MSKQPETTLPRAYTLNEIDRMRSALYRIHAPGQLPNNCILPSGYFEKQEVTIRETVEGQLRTYMIGGIAAEELEEKANAKN